MTYTIIEATNVTQAIIDVCQQDSMDTLRKSLDSSLVVLKWKGIDPSVFDNETKYTHSEARAIIVTAEWTEQES
jgi:hypothetical protein